MAKPQTTLLQQKIFLLCFSIIFSLLLLEAGLRLGGYIFFAFQEKSNQTAPANEDEFRILCIGESTTALGRENSYPAQLERILNEKSSARRFKVINKGIPGTRTVYILADIDQMLEKYKPHMVVGMMGVNDGLVAFKESYLEKIKNHFKRYRVYKLFVYLTTGLNNNFFKKDGSAKKESIIDDSYPVPKELEGPPPIDVDEITEDNIKVFQGEDERLKAVLQTLFYQLQKTESPQEKAKIEKRIVEAHIQRSWIKIFCARYLVNQGNFAPAEDLLMQAIRTNPKFYAGYVDLGVLYRKKKQIPQAIEALKRGIVLSPNIASSYIEMAYVFADLNQMENAMKMIDQAFTKQADKDVEAFSKIGIHFYDTGRYKQAAYVFEKIIENKNRHFHHNMYLRLADIYGRLGDKEKEQYYRNRLLSTPQKIEHYHGMTVYAYNKIVEKVQGKQIVFVSMQYPLRSIESVKKILDDKSGIIFVENKDNFRRVLNMTNYFDYFVDEFAGDFGHCSIKGNQLIASNLADIILEYVNKE